MKKRIIIEFAAYPQIKAVDAFDDIKHAVKSASYNLYGRYRIQLNGPYLVDERFIVVDVVGDDLERFAEGNRLRGISLYLLKYGSIDYSAYKCGYRLLNYTEVPVLENIAKID